MWLSQGIVFPQTHTTPNEGVGFLSWRKQNLKQKVSKGVKIYMVIVAHGLNYTTSGCQQQSLT